MLKVTKKISPDDIIVIENFFNQPGKTKEIINAVQSLLSFLQLDSHKTKAILNNAKNQIRNIAIDLNESCFYREIILNKSFLNQLTDIIAESAKKDRQAILFRDYKKIYALFIE